MHKNMNMNVFWSRHSMPSKCDNIDFCSSYGGTVCRANVKKEIFVQAMEALYIEQM